MVDAETLKTELDTALGDEDITRAFLRVETILRQMLDDGRSKDDICEMVTDAVDWQKFILLPPIQQEALLLNLDRMSGVCFPEWEIKAAKS